MAQKQNNIHQGHRNKVRKRYIQTGLTGMAEHNVLEILLFYGIAVKDTNPIAHDLIDKFGSLPLVLQANQDELFEVKNVTKNAACLLSLILPLQQRYQTRLNEPKYQLNSSAQIIEYMRSQFNLSTPKIYALCFDFKHDFISCLHLSNYDFNDIEFDFKELALAALKIKAASVVLIHTHYNGLSKPSKEDVKATKIAFKMLKNLNIYLENHLIISNDNYFSMKDRSEYTIIFNDF